MATYTYTARLERGAPVTGTVAGDSKAAAAAELRRKGLTVLALDEKKGLGDLNELLEGLTKVKLHDKVVFSRQFATMINAGLALLRALFILEEQTQNPRFRKIITAVRQDVEAGMPLSDAIEKHPAAFDRLYVSMVRAGEIGGVLDQTLERLATQLEKDDSLRRSVKSAMTYPILIGVFALLVLFGLIVFVIPIFAGMYNDLGGQLPLLTRIMVGASDFMRSFWFIVVPAFFLFIYGLRRLRRTPQGTAAWDRAKLRLPMKLGPIIQKIAVARFSRTLATLVSSGVPILQAIEITGKTSGNTVIENAMNEVREQIKGGESIARPLEKVPVFPPMVTQMIAIGEETGALDTMLHKVADFYEDEVDAAIKSLTSILEPIMMIFIGGIVGLVVVSMYLPIFNLFQLVQ
ncbi:MAG: type II secretion system F family protein [Thermoleophilia bacterium]|nr:type II secretion system F family protein [Thermoleophilia bacterium]